MCVGDGIGRRGDAQWRLRRMHWNRFGMDAGEIGPKNNKY